MKNKIVESIIKHLKVNVTDIKLFGKGKCNFVYLVTLVGAKQLIIKEERFDKETEEQNHIITEAKTIKYLNKKIPSLKIPRVRFFDADLGLYCYDFISGKPMKTEWEKMSQAERVDLCKNLGRFHAEFHQSLTLDEAKQLGLVINQKPDLEADLLKHLDILLQKEDLPESLSLLIKKVIDIFEQTTREAFFSLIHNDIHNENILITKNDISAVIDFGDTEFDDIRKDFHRYLCDYPDYFNYILDEYQNNVDFSVSKVRIISYAILLLAWKIDCEIIDSPENKKLMEQIMIIYKKYLIS